MSEPRRIAETVATVFKVPASVRPDDPEDRFKRAMAAAVAGQATDDWDSFTAEQYAELRLAYVEARWDRIGEAIGLPARLKPARLERDRPTQAMSRATQYLREGEYAAGCCLVLTGPTGVGKSWAASAAMFELQRLPRVPARRFKYFPALCGALLDPHRRREALDEATKTHVLVLDDLGVEYVKDGGLIDTFLDEIIWTRESEYRPTIITTNLTTDQLKQRLPGRLVDRLRGDWGRVFECPGESLRGAQ